MTKPTTTTPEAKVVHAPDPLAAGVAPKRARQVTVWCHNRGDYDNGSPIIKGRMYVDTPQVCPDMPTIWEVDGVLYFDGTKGELAAWKAVYTKRGAAGPLAYSLDTKAEGEQVDPAASAAARKAWDTRRENAAKAAK